MDNLPDHLVLFDGVCNLCNRVVRHIIKYDKKNLFRFASLQSRVADKIRDQLSIPGNTDSIIYLRKGEIYVHSAAALKIAKDLGGRHHLWHLLMIIPQPVRDFFYRIIARKRYVWFGKRDSCLIPGKEEAGRFIG
jgi:predicted DCC family thiol-disulfide oxidoreductase YuxK